MGCGGPGGPGGCLGKKTGRFFFGGVGGFNLLVN